MASKKATKKRTAESAEASAANTISAIKVRGFKSIHDETEIEIRPLTILAGANSSGKSSMVQPLLLLKQTLEAGFDPGPLLLDGPNVSLGPLKQELSRIPGRRPAEDFSVAVRTAAGDWLELEFRPGHEGVTGLEETRRFGQAELPDISLHEGMNEDERATLHGLLRAHTPEPEEEPPRLTVSRSRCFMSVNLEYPRHYAVIVDPLGLSGGVRSCVESTIHVPGLRGQPARSYPRASTGPSYPGPFNAYVASLILAWESGRDARAEGLVDALLHLGLTGGVSAKPINDTAIEVLVDRLPTRSGVGTDRVNLADVGTGVSQVLPVVVALLAAKEGQFVYLEQPEIHLHPRAQHLMAELLADAAKRGVRVVAESHSALLLLGIQTLVAEREEDGEPRLDPELVKLYWFEREADGATKVTSGDLDEQGAFGDWPTDFGTAEMAAEDRYLDAVGL